MMFNVLDEIKVLILSLHVTFLTFCSDLSDHCANALYLGVQPRKHSFVDRVLWNVLSQFKKVVHILWSQCYGKLLWPLEVCFDMSFSGQTSLILYCLSPIVVLLKIFPFSTAVFMDIALRKSRILFLI